MPTPLPRPLQTLPSHPIGTNLQVVPQYPGTKVASGWGWDA